MIAVILAAGMSKRLRPITNDIPKCLLPVGETTVLTRYLNILENVGITKTIIVNGFNCVAVEKEVHSHKRTMSIQCITNQQYDSTHPIESFLLTESFIDEDFLLLNSDIYFSEKTIQTLVDSPNSCVAIDSQADFINGEMFVNYNSEMRVSEISKSLTAKKTLQGKSIQVTKFLQQDKNTLFNRSKELAGNPGAFYPAQAFDTLIDQDRFYAVDVAGDFTHELDTIEDYHSLLSQIKSKK